MMTARRPPLPLFAAALALLAACDDSTGLSRVSFRLRAAGVARDASQPLTLTTQSGWDVTVSAARVALGPFYFNVAAPVARRPLSLLREARADVGQSQLESGRIVAQVTERIVVDALDPTPRLVGDGDGTSEQVNTAELWLLPQAPGGAPELAGAVAELAGEARRGADVVPFLARLKLDQAQVDKAASQTLQDLRTVRGVPASLPLQTAAPSGAEVLLRVDPAPLLAQADFAPLLNAPPVDGRYQASDSDLVTLALRQGVRQRSGVYQFLWQPAR